MYHRAIRSKMLNKSHLKGEVWCSETRTRLPWRRGHSGLGAVENCRHGRGRGCRMQIVAGLQKKVQRCAYGLPEETMNQQCADQAINQPEAEGIRLSLALEGWRSDSTSGS